MHVLHICSDYSKQKLYKELISYLAINGIKQTVFVPVRSKEEIGMYNIDNIANVKVHYAHILRKYHRIFYFSKIKTIYKYLIRNEILKDVTLIHAHFLFSDGGVGYIIKKEIKIPYITAIRNTDVNFFFKYFIHLRRYGRKIIQEAEKIVFISPAYQSLVEKKYQVNLHQKALVIPNGLKDFWFLNENSGKKQNFPLKLLYVGDFTKNKNVPRIIEFVDRIQEETSCSLTLVGGGGSNHNEIMHILKNTNDRDVKYLGRITDEKKLIELFDSHDIFIMLSFLETFGLVYVEALSRGLPIIHSKDQGVDGYFESGIFSFPCSPTSYDDFLRAIKTIKNNYQTRSNKARLSAKSFNWIEISSQYLEMYKNIT